MMRVRVTPGPEFVGSSPSRLFAARIQPKPNLPQCHAVTADGQRFLALNARRGTAKHPDGPAQWAWRKLAEHAGAVDTRIQPVSDRGAPIPLACVVPRLRHHVAHAIAQRVARGRRDQAFDTPVALLCVPFYGIGAVESYRRRSRHRNDYDSFQGRAGADGRDRRPSRRSIASGPGRLRQGLRASGVSCSAFVCVAVSQRNSSPGRCPFPVFRYSNAAFLVNALNADRSGR